MSDSVDPQPQTGLRGRMARAKEKMRSRWERYEPYAPAIFFVLGFLFDVFTLERIDSLFQILQQGVFLLAVFVLLTLMILDQEKGIAIPRRLQGLWNYRVEAIHFLIGGLLSAFTLFFIKSASIFSSAVFVLFMVALLVANEFHRIQSLGLTFKYALFALCLVCFLAYVVPIVTGFIGFGPLLIVVGLSAVLIALISYAYLKWGLAYETMMKQVVRPSLLVLLSFVLLYWLKLIPPVPLSVQFMGVYHKVEKTPEGQYALYHENPWWRFWHNGDQVFRMQDGDQLYTFVRIFSPTAFKDQVQLHFLRKLRTSKWESMDRIPIRIVGGRAEGFRGYTYKSSILPGSWRVQVETRAGREIGRMYFSIVEDDPARIRDFDVEVY